MKNDYSESKYENKIRPHRIEGAYIERELTEPVELCDANGKLNPAAIGWSRFPLHICNLSGGWPRKKKWHYWCVTTDDFLFSFTVANIDYIGLVGAYFLDLKTQEFIEDTVITPMGRGCAMPLEVEKSVYYSHPRMIQHIVHDDRIIHANIKCKKLGGKNVSADLIVHKPENHESLNVVIPWGRERFQFTSKQNTLPAEGVVNVAGVDYEFKSGKSWATLDFGRGLWPYNTSWNWGAFSGVSEDGVVGVNIGSKWTDGVGYNENGICLDGKLYKIGEDLLWEYDPREFTAPWRIRTQYSDALDLTFVPFYERNSTINLLLLKTEAHQCFGHYSGRLKCGDKFVRVENILGWAEEHRARW